MRPAEKSTRSETIRFPDARNSTPRRGGPSDTSNRSTVSPKRKVTLRFLIWWMSSSTISRSAKSSTRSRRSTTVTSIPSMAKIDAYSIPTTPPPTTVMARGRRFRRMMSSLVIATSPSSTAPGGVTARVPTATTIVAARTTREPVSDRIRRV